MIRDGNVIGRVVARLRYQKAWTQEQLVTKMQLQGCYITRDMLANIENNRASVTDKEIEHFAEAFGIREVDLFPPVRHFKGKPLGVVAPGMNHHRAQTSCAGGAAPQRRRSRRKSRRSPRACRQSPPSEAGPGKGA